MVSEAPGYERRNRNPKRKEDITVSKRLVALILAILMALSLIPAALAEGEEEQPPQENPAETVNENQGEDLAGNPEEGQETPAEEQSEPPMGDNYIEQIINDPNEWPKTMYVYTENGGTLNVRSEPMVRDGNVIGKLEYGAEVIVEGYVVINTDWSVIRYKKGPDGVGYVMNRFLVDKKPGKSSKQKEAEQRTRDLEQMNKELASAETFDQPMMAVVRANRTSGWTNFRSGPSTAADKIGTLQDGHELKLIGQTKDWYQAVDLATGKTGYIHKNFITVMATPVPEEKQQLGRLNVNGAFTLQCRLPDGYKMQTINAMGSKIFATITPEDTQKPVLSLTIAFNELYSDVPRLNDLGEEDLKLLEETFTEMNDVEIGYRETAYGTKLLVARETGDDTDFVDILTVYRGYFIEFLMTPNPDAANQELTEAQIQMCVDFLSDLDFVEAN